MTEPVVTVRSKAPYVVVTRKMALEPERVLADAYRVRVFEHDRAMTRAEIVDAARDAHALVVMPGDSVDRTLLEACPSLLVVASHAVGYDGIDTKGAAELGVWVTNTPDVLTDATADLTIALLLTLARRVREGETLVRSGSFYGWSPTMLLGRELRDQVLGVVGMGRIGRAVAHRASAFGMRVVHTSRTHPENASERQREGWMPLDELLAYSDVITVHCPLTAKTRHLIDASAFARMKRSAIVVNTARGPIVDEDALVTALEEGRIAGAALDVYEHEPRVHERLLRRDDVVLLPHLGSATRETREKMATLALSNVLDVLEGRAPRTPVNAPSSPRTAARGA